MAIRIKSNIGYKRTPRGFANARPSVAAATADVRGQMNAIIKNLEKVIVGIQDATVDAVRYGLQPIFDKSQVYVPVDTSELKNSGYLVVEKRGDNVEAEIGYGKGGKPYYAPFVHEDLESSHAAPTQAKFLERAIDQHREEILPRIAMRIKSRTGL